MEETKPNSDCNVIVNPNGPLMVIGRIDIKHSDGRIENKEKNNCILSLWSLDKQTILRW